MTLRERDKIRKQGLLYERERQHNIVHNWRVLNALQVPAAAKDLARVCVEPPARMSKGGNAEDLVQTAKDRLSREPETQTSSKSSTTVSAARSTHTRATTNFDAPPSPNTPSFDTFSSASALEDAIGELNELLNIGEDISLNNNGSSYDTDRSPVLTSKHSLNNEDEVFNRADQNTATTTPSSQGHPDAAPLHKCHWQMATRTLSTGRTGWNLFCA